MARTQKEPELIDVVVDRIEELAQENPDFLVALNNILVGDATTFDILDVLSAGLPEQEGEEEAEQEPEPEEAPRRGRGRPAAVVEDDEPAPAPIRRGRR